MVVDNDSTDETGDIANYMILSKTSRINVISTFADFPLLDAFETSAGIQSRASCGASSMKINHALAPRQNEIRRVLKMVVDRNLLEIDPPAVYWMTIKGLEFLGPIPH